ncbi:MAG: c-type cytochrome [Ginsengibacter sp.]
MISKPVLLLLLPALLLLTFSSCKHQYKDKIYLKPAITNPPLQSLTPAESIKKFYLPEGYKIELVASEPMIGEPVSIAWDGNGNMYVAEMNTYMQDADANNENAPTSKVLLLQDTNGDGNMDKSSVFIDSLVLPRILMPLDDRVIIGETFNRNLYSYRDTNGDGKADEKILILEDTTRDNRNLEHQDANMLWNIDNWLYVSNKSFRYRFINNRLIRDTLPEPMPGQWGLTQDETGRLFFSRAGAEVPALGFQQPPVYGSLEMKEPWNETFVQPWPVISTPDAQGGPRRMRPGDNTLNKFTGVAGQEIFLGNKMPPAYGDLFIPEPVGRLVRRAKVNHVQGKIFLENRYDSSEFLASADPLFRPVYATTGPDGCLYIVDMYRGIIQEGTWVGEGSYLRKVVKERGYDKFVQKGRIYRIYHEDTKPGEAPQLLGKTASQLISYLSHPNGWWRMTAQKLIILKGDTSVANELRNIVISNDGFFTKIFHSKNDYGLERLHALWTLEGLRCINESILKIALQDKDPRVRVAAIRISEPLLKQGSQPILEALKQLKDDKDPEVIQQLLLTFRARNNETKSITNEILKSFAGNELIKLTAQENLNPSFSEIQQLSDQYKLKGGEMATQIIHGFKLFQENCATCHGHTGQGTPQLAPPLVGSLRLKDTSGIALRILLNGLTGPVDGVQYNGPMASQAAYTDEELADIVSYIREHLNNSGTIWRGNVTKVREKYKTRKTYWTLAELSKEK